MVLWLEVVLEKLQTGVGVVEEALEVGVVVVEVRMDKMLLKIGDRVQLKQAKVQIHIEIKIFLLMMNLRLYMIKLNQKEETRDLTHKMTSQDQNLEVNQRQDRQRMLQKKLSTQIQK